MSNLFPDESNINKDHEEDSFYIEFTKPYLRKIVDSRTYCIEEDYKSDKSDTIWFLIHRTNNEIE